MMGSAAADLTNGFIGTVVMIISAYFFIADRERLTEGFWRIVPEDLKPTVRDIKDKVIAALGDFSLLSLRLCALCL